MSDHRQRVEAAARAACETGDFDAATTIAIREYGPEILGVLVAKLRSESEAADVFALFCEDVWHGLPGFRWQCSLRVWAYTLSRHAASRYIAAASRRRQRTVPFSQAEAISKVAAEVKSTTLPHLRTEMKSTMRRLREQLPAEEQELIILRIDKQLSWQDMAVVIDGEALLSDDEALKRTAARLRKRFQLAKDKLHALAVEAGLLTPE